ncbi:nitrogen assimilation transcription factor nirA [Histoplasma capsulatum var. duboisii H88]|uniref:Nitrogen assimilation transcription factor nirA n=1 Tax=Ajellomyces capsulatus (strain H88) TaxID=544711 RepID=A0A8A1LQC9_AJEC8|nr:nitrogen assimilation transcription factor nirA [Histoplasma capsulatum var. duboisii H88]
MADDNGNQLGTEQQPVRPDPAAQVGKSKSRLKSRDGTTAAKRRCVSTACIACRKRKSKCDGNTPTCAACASVYHTPCIYDPNSDHRRKGVYKQDIDNLKNRNTTLQTLVQAILNYDEADVPELVRQIRSCEDLEQVADSILAREKTSSKAVTRDVGTDDDNGQVTDVPQFESELAGKMSELIMDGSVRFVGGTSNLIFLPAEFSFDEPDSSFAFMEQSQDADDAITGWTRVTKSKELIRHLLTMYFTWHYAYFTTMSKKLFYRDFIKGRPTQYCSPLLVNAMLALGCHFSSWPAARRDPKDSATAGDHFFKEAKKLILENDEHERAKLCTVQALALMSVREAGCGREGSGWVYSGMSFRMAYDLGLNLDGTGIASHSLTEEDIDARRMSFWGCFLFDKCWSNYLGRQPQLLSSSISVPKFDVFPDEDAEMWSPYTDSGVTREHIQPSRTRAVSLQILRLSEISSDLLSCFYHPKPVERHIGKQEELKRLSQLHTRLEAWRKGLPKEMEPKEGQLPQVLLMHMFFQLLFIHLYRPFLKYTKSTSPLPPHVSPRKLCTQSASTISKLLRLYKRTYGFRQICNISVYIAHSACTIHLLNLPDKTAKRDLIHGLKNLEEIAESWLCARRTLRILDMSAQKWNVDLPSEAVAILERSHAKFGPWGSWDQVHSPSNSEASDRERGKRQRSENSQSCTTPEPVPLSSKSTIPAPVKQASTPLPNPLFSQYHAFSPATTQSSPQQPTHPANLPSSLLPHHTFSVPAPKRSYSSNLDTVLKHEPWTNTSQSPVDMSTKNNSLSSLSIPQLSALGGMESLVEASQDWWLKDQNALALGLGNWGDSWDNAPGPVCTSMGFEASVPAVALGSSNGQIIGSNSHNLGADQLSNANDGMGINMPLTLPGYDVEYTDESGLSQTRTSLDQDNPQPEQTSTTNAGSGTLGQIYY